jgi:plasmid maintenance system killer protein
MAYLKEIYRSNPNFEHTIFNELIPILEFKQEKTRVENSVQVRRTSKFVKQELQNLQMILSNKKERHLGQTNSRRVDLLIGSKGKSERVAGEYGLHGNIEGNELET